MDADDVLAATAAGCYAIVALVLAGVVFLFAIGLAGSVVSDVLDLFR